MERVAHVVLPEHGVILRALCGVGAVGKLWGYPDEVAAWHDPPCHECMDIAITIIAQESVVEYMSAHDAILEGL